VPYSHKQSNNAHPILRPLTRRWSPYGYSDEPVTHAELRSIFEAARWAASAFNEQPWRFVVGTREQPEAHEKILSCLVEANQAWARHAPVLVLCCVSRRFARNDKDNRAAEHDLGLATGNLMAEASERGLLVHAMAGVELEKAATAHALPDGFEVWTALAIGHPGKPKDLEPGVLARDDKPRERRPLSELVFEGEFGQAASWLEG
jgi:nitroreductase